MAAWVLGALNTPFGSDSDGGSRGFDLASLPETSLIRSLLSHLLVPKGNLPTSPHAPPVTQRASLDYLLFHCFLHLFNYDADKSARSLAAVLQILAKCHVDRLPILQWSTVLKNLMHAGLGEVR